MCAGPTRPADRSQIPLDDKVESGEIADEEHQVHEHINNKTSWVKMSEDTATMTRPDALQSMSLEGESAPQASNGSAELIACEPDEAKATQDQGQVPVTTSASTQSVSR